jgi:hypothetical protein
MPHISFFSPGVPFMPWPGHILTVLYNGTKNQYAQIEAILRYLTVKEFNDQKFTRLEEAGSKADEKPGISRIG